MKIIRFLDDAGQEQLGRLQDDGSATLLEGELLGELRDTGRPATVAKLLAPLEPAAILCIGLNYRRHAEEGGKPVPEHPVLFMKLPSVVTHPGDPIVLPRHLRSDRVDYECELAVVIGRECKNTSRDTALQYVLGYTCAQ